MSKEMNVAYNVIFVHISVRIVDYISFIKHRILFASENL